MRDLLRLDQRPAAAPPEDGAANRWRVLVPHFFGRFFDKESVSPQGDPQAPIVQTLGVIATPGVIFIVVFQALLIRGWDLVAVRCMSVTFSMVVMGFVMVFSWDALFPDRRDYQILTPLPLGLTTVFAAKTIALAMFVGIFLLAANIVTAFFWPAVEAKGGMLAIMARHATAVAAGGLFMALGVAALRGVIATVFGGAVERRISVAVQALLMGVLVMFFVLIPIMGFGIRHLIRDASPWVYWFPNFWFTGVYERMRPTVGHPTLVRLGGIGLHALWCAALVFVVTYLPFYRRHARRVMETPQPRAAGPGPLRRWAGASLDRFALRQPIERAVFHFITQTIARSTRHRFFLATYGGFGAAVAIITLRSGASGLLALPLVLSFVLVSGLRAAFNFPSELQANWAFQVSETAGVAAYLSATRKWVLLCGILPLFALMAPLEFVFFPWTAALFHIAYGITLSVLLTEIMFLDFRKVPFTCARLPGKVNMVGLGSVYIYGFTAYSGTMAELELLLTGMPGVAALFFAVAALACLTLRRYSLQAVNGAAALEYEDPGDPAVRTLGITPE